jgi:hypothetical protein
MFSVRYELKHSVTFFRLILGFETVSPEMVTVSYTFHASPACPSDNERHGDEDE